jgi:RimJ/RimL family protein N-acetyltransferase
MPVIIETPRLLLRTWALNDAEAAFAFYSDPEVMRFLSAGTQQSVEDVRRFLAARPIASQALHGMTLWATVEKATGLLVGACGLKFLDGGMDVEVGYHFARAVWGRGYATESAAAAVRYGFDRLCLRRILGVVNPENHASQRVLVKIGLRYQGMGRYYNIDAKVYAADRLGTIPTA